MTDLFGKGNSRSLEMLFARIQIAAPTARSIMIASIAGDSVSDIAQQVFEQAKRAGQPIRLLALPRETETHSGRPPDIQVSAQTTLEPTQVGSVDGIKKALAGFDGWSLLQGGSLMSSPETLRAAAACDGTVLVLKQKADSR